jgi:hypothetical protein
VGTRLLEGTVFVTIVVSVSGAFVVHDSVLFRPFTKIRKEVSDFVPTVLGTRKRGKFKAARFNHEATSLEVPKQPSLVQFIDLSRFA